MVISTLANVYVEITQDSVSGCDKCMEPVAIVTWCGQWVVHLLDYLMKYPTPLVSVLLVALSINLILQITVSDAYLPT